MGTWAVFETPVATGRSRRQLYVGTASGNTSKTNPGPAGLDGTFDPPGSGGTDIWSWWAPWDPPTGPPTISVDRNLAGAPGGATYGYYGSHIVVRTLGVSAEAWDAHANAPSHNFAYSYTAAFGWSLDSLELTKLHIEDGTEAVYMDGVPYPVDGGNAQPDGPPALKRSYYEVSADGVARAWCDIGDGHASVEVPIAAGTILVLYNVYFYAAGDCVNTSQSFAANLVWNDGDGPNPGFPNYANSNGGYGPTGHGAISVTAGDSGFEITGSSSGSDPDSGGVWEVSGFVGQAIRRKYRSLVTAWDQVHPGGLHVSFPSGSIVANSGDYLETIRSYDFGCTMYHVVQPGSASPDTYADAGAWLSGMAGSNPDGSLDVDDRRDWRMRVLTMPWAAGTVSLASSHVGVSSAEWDRTTLDAAHPSASVSLTSPANAWECYRYATLALTGHGFGHRPVTISLANDRITREYRVTTGDDGEAVTRAIDGCIPINAPDDLEEDRRRGRWPTQRQYSGTQSPIAKPPEERTADVNPPEGADEPEEEDRGWMSGWNQPTTVTVSCELGAGESITIGDLTLTATSANLTLLDAFKAGSDEGGYGASYDGYERLWDYAGSMAEGAAVIGTSYGGPFATMVVDGRVAWDLPAYWRDVPVSGDPSVAFLTIHDLLQMLPAFAGVSVTETSSWPAPYVGNDALAAYLGGAGWVYPYGTGDGSTDVAWVSAIEIALGTVWAQEGVDRVRDYPGCGNVCGGGSWGVVTIYAAAKVVRSRDAGILFDAATYTAISGGTVATTDDVSGLSSGNGTSDAQGYYRSGLPFGRGPKRHTTTRGALSDSVFWRNRRPSRHSFLGTERRRRRLTLGLTSRRDGRIFYAGAIGTGTDLIIGSACPDAPTSFAPTAPIDRDPVAIALATGIGTDAGLWVAMIESDGSADLRLTHDLGSNYSTVTTLPSCDAIDVCRAPDGRLYVWTVESGAVVRRIYGADGAAIGGATTTSVSGLSDRATIRTTAYPTGDSSFGIDLAVKDGSTSYVLSSDDGGAHFA